MGKIYVKCKDKTSSVWLMVQRISVVGSIPQIVEETADVSKRIALGALVKSNANEYNEYHKKAKAPKADKVKLAMDLFDGSLNTKDVDACKKHLKAAKSNGLKAAGVKKAEEQIIHLEGILKSEAEAEARKVKAQTLVEEAIEIELFVENNSKFLCLGEKALGKDAEQIIIWTSANDDNIEELEKAITKKKANKPE